MSAVTTTARIALKDNERLERLAQYTGESKTKVIGQALEAFEREYLLNRINAGFDELRSDPEAWAAELEERGAWDGTTAGRGISRDHGPGADPCEGDLGPGLIR